MSCAPVESSVALQVRPSGRWIGRIAAATVAGLAGVAGALSYSHMRQLAQDHGQAGWYAHAFPLSVDGIEIVASLVLLADRRAGRRSGWLPWAALALGTVGSLAANVATAHPDSLNRVIAGWPALALLIAVKLLSGLLERPPARDAGATAAYHARQAIEPDAPATEAHVASSGQAAKFAQSAGAAGTWSGSAQSQEHQPSSPPPTTGAALDGLAPELLSAARAAKDALCQDGQTLTRDTLAARLRQHGYPIRNARVTPLLRQLRHEGLSRRAA
jgi:hypothetical protein